MSKQELFCEKNGKLHVGHTILTGFAFLASSIAWAIYDPYITKILNRLLTESAWITALSAKLNELFPVLADFAKSQGQDVGTAAGGITLVPLFIGVIMTFDNIFGVIFQPTFGKLSDRCRSKLGKRRPFVVYGAPVSAALFAIIPLVALTNSLPATMLCIILFVFSMSLWRAPAVALMPALTPPSLRSEGNAIINLMGGVGSVIGMAAGGVVAAVYALVTSVEVTAENEQSTTFPFVFLVGAIVMVLGMLVIRFFVKEPSSKLEAVAAKNQLADEKAKAKAEKEAKKAEKAAAKKEKLSKGERKSHICMLGGLFFLFCGTNAITTFFALFAAEVLGKTTGEATFMTTLFAICSAIAAIPAGKMGKKLGRKKTILIGLIVFMTVFLLYVVTGSMAVIWVALVFGGFANMLITVNTLPLVLEIGGINKVGTFTGYYYTATFSAQIASPIVYGIVRMFTGSYLSLFVYSPVMFALSILLIFFVKHGEAVPDDVIKKVKEENED
ncbi:MAG: MFS transporter [Clostridia bacterium]|nr:MFS transporter [Clostridia bacterium]